MKLALITILALLFLAAVLLQRTFRGLPANELRRRARLHKDKRTTALYKLAAFGSSAELFLWLAGSLSAVGLAVLSFKADWWLGGLVILIITGLLWMGRPLQSVDGWLWRLASLAASPAVMAVAFLQPALGRLSRIFNINTTASAPGLYEKEDLLELLKIQGRRPENRISDSEIKIAAGALSLGDKTVLELMTPRSKVKWAAAGDSISPLVMDELHKSGQAAFPVVKEVIKTGNPEILGALYITDVLKHLEDGGRVRDIMHQGTNYINETQSLAEALNNFLVSHVHLLVVVNNFEEIVGVLTLEDVLGQIFGDEMKAESDQYENIRIAAKHDQRQTDSQQPQAKVE